MDQVPTPSAVAVDRPAPLPDITTVLAQFKTIVPAKGGSSWTKSPIGVYEDGRMESVLVVLARTKYGPYDNDTHMAYWKDRDPSNVTWANVRVARRARRSRAVNPYGAPSGTAEYWRAYRRAHPERMKTYQQRNTAKRKAELQQARKDAEEQVAAMLMTEENTDASNVE